VLLTPACPASSWARFLALFSLAPIFAGLVFLQFLKVLVTPKLDSDIGDCLRGRFGYLFVPNPSLQGATVNVKDSGRFRDGVSFQD
jgi:hypothetical protein